jgi:hypothetical protein
MSLIRVARVGPSNSRASPRALRPRSSSSSWHRIRPDNSGSLYDKPTAFLQATLAARLEGPRGFEDGSPTLERRTNTTYGEANR